MSVMTMRNKEVCSCVICRITDPVLQFNNLCTLTSISYIEGLRILCLWFRASLSYINNYPRCNTKQSIYYSASSLYMFRVSTTLIIRSKQNCTYSLQYWSYCKVKRYFTRRVYNILGFL
jgi:hypothetical protein